MSKSLKIALSIVLGIIVGLLMLKYEINDFNDDYMDEMDNINQVIITEELQKFKIVLNSGDDIDICVQAGMVSSAYLMAKDEENYIKWKEIEKKYCDTIQY